MGSTSFNWNIDIRYIDQANSIWTSIRNADQMIRSDDEVHSGSFALKIASLQDWGIIVYTPSLTDTPSDVTIETWAYLIHHNVSGGIGNLAFFFRFQNENQYYSVVLQQYTDTTVRAYFALRNQSLSLGNYVEISAPKGTWYNWKIKLCEHCEKIYANIFLKEAGNWVQRGKFERSPIYWSEGGSIGVGFEEFAEIPFLAYMDETKIYY